jgi:cytochrome c-type biogenesis protein CcmH
VTALYAVAALLSAIAIGILILPLVRQRRLTGRWSTLGLGVSFAIVPVAFALYQHVSNWDPEGQDRADRGTALVKELAARLERSPDDVDGWEFLGRTYLQLGDYEHASRAYREAWNRTPQPDSELKLAFAEAQILSDRATLGGDAGKLVEQVLADEPANPKALWYGGLVAFELGHEEDVKARWSRLLELNPPAEIATMLRTQLAALGETLPAGSAGAGAGAAPTGSAAAAGPSVQLDVSLGAGRSIQQLPPTAALFIFARAPGGGPPLAVIRQPATAVPGQFTLSDANSMIPGRSLGDYDELTLVARLSKSGQPIEQPGDWKGQALFRPKEGGTVALVIDQVVQ